MAGRGRARQDKTADAPPGPSVPKTPPSPMRPGRGRPMRSGSITATPPPGGPPAAEQPTARARFDPAAGTFVPRAAVNPAAPAFVPRTAVNPAAPSFVPRGAVNPAAQAFVPSVNPAAPAFVPKVNPAAKAFVPRGTPVVQPSVPRYASAIRLRRPIAEAGAEAQNPPVVQPSVPRYAAAINAIRNRKRPETEPQGAAANPIPEFEHVHLVQKKPSAAAAAAPTSPFKFPSLSPPAPKPPRFQGVRRRRTKDPAMGPFSLEEKQYTLGNKLCDSSWSPNVEFFPAVKGTSLKVCVRRVTMAGLDENYEDAMWDEIKALRHVDNKHCVRMMACFYLRQAEASNDPSKIVVLIEEWLSESLLDRIARFKYQPMTPDDVIKADRQFFELVPSGVDLRSVKIWMGQIAQAIEYLHFSRIVHGRIEPNSVMIRRKDRAILSHFLCAQTYYGPGGTRPFKFMNPSYMGPDLTQQCTEPNWTWDGKENDVWGFGCTCFYAMCGNHLFTSNLAMRPMQHHNANALIDFQKVSHREKNFLKMLLLPNRRITAIEQVLKTDWFVMPQPHPTSPSLNPAVSSDKGTRAKTFNVLGAPHGDTYTIMADKGYALTHLIGKGGFGAVYAGTKDEDGRMVPVAMKMIGGFNKVKEPNSAWYYRTKRYPTELKVMTKLKHPNLVYVYEVFLESNTHGREWERRSYIWMERSKTDLYKLACETPNYTLPQQVLAPLIAHSLNGLEFLHENRIAHRDIKPANILIFDTPQGLIAKITDYSLIRETDYNTISQSVAATKGYQSPDCILKRYNPFKLDVFSMGITIFVCLIGRKPGWDPDKVRDEDTLVHEFTKLVNDVNARFMNHPVLRRLIRDQMLTLRDADRATVKQLKQNPWFPNVWTHPMYQVKNAIHGFKDH